VSERPPPRPDLGEPPQTPFATWRRLHPAAIAVWAAGIVGNLAFPIVLFLLVGEDQGPIGVFAVVTVVAMLATVVRWSRFAYKIDRDALVLRGGLLQRWERTIQRSRIQSVDVVRKLTHRLFGVVELRVEVVGGQTTEGSLVAVTPWEADALRGILIADRPPETDRAEPPLIRMRPRDLLLAGVTGGRIAVLAGIVGWATQLLPGDLFVRVLDRVAGADRSEVETIAAIAAALVIGSIVISLISTVVVYWGFTAERHGDRLVISRGLLQTRRTVVPLARIQSIRLEENLIRRPFRLASLRVLTAGYGKRSGDEQQTSMLVPVAARDRCTGIAATILGWSELPAVEVGAAPRSALWLRLARAAAVGVVAVVVWAITNDDRSLAIAIPILSSVLLLAILSWRGLGHAVSDRHVVARWGTLLRRTSVAATSNVQHLVLRRTPVQRLFGLATVRLAIPKASMEMIDLETGVADERFDELTTRLLHPDDDPAAARAAG
jgi:putative membrane protein